MTAFRTEEPRNFRDFNSFSIFIFFNRFHKPQPRNQLEKPKQSKNYSTYVWNVILKHTIFKTKECVYIFSIHLLLQGYEREYENVQFMQDVSLNDALVIVSSLEMANILWSALFYCKIICIFTWMYIAQFSYDFDAKLCVWCQALLSPVQLKASYVIVVTLKCWFHLWLFLFLISLFFIILSP